ncbi:MAG: hypothetical protein ACK4K9_04190 [Bacteroidia bacterium]
MHEISRKKDVIKIQEPLRNYLKRHGRENTVAIHYKQLQEFIETVSLYDKKGKDTLWETCIYKHEDFNFLQQQLVKIYALLKTGGDLHVIEHLYVERIDNCLYGNTSPFRIRIVNRLNDNFDYFYIKHADASRIYGLELEHLLSPNRINYLVNDETLIEEHIAGIPGDDFVKNYMYKDNFNATRLAKEFVKFNERCFIRLLGDMHSSNFVIQFTPDFEEVHYRIRAIDFDQQCYNGRKNIYLPQFYKQNKPFVELVMKQITIPSMQQYQREERAIIVSRMKAAKWPLQRLTDAMCLDNLAPEKNVERLKNELSEFYQSKRFLKAHNMGEVLKASLLHTITQNKTIALH